MSFNPILIFQNDLILQSKYNKRALVNSKFRIDVESFDLKFELKIGNPNESINFVLKL